MNNQEAIRLLERTRPKDNNAISLMLNEALNMAIKALEQEPSGDLISRDKVHEIIAVALSEYITDEERETLETLDVDVANIPTVQEPKTGHWITIEMTQDDGCRYTVTYCSECDEDVDYRTDYCPNCGCRMVQERSEE